jgi:polyphosphate kinase
LETHFADTSRARLLRPDGTWQPILPSAKKKALRSQDCFAKEASRRSKQRNHAPDLLIPHTPKS